MIEKKLTSLTGASFNDFGKVVSNEGKGCGFANSEFSYWGSLANAQFGESASIGMISVNKRELIVDKLERHSKTNEMLVALSGDVYIVFASPEWDTKTSSGLKAFLLKQGDTILMHSGTWHSLGYPTNKESVDLLVTFSSGTEEHDLEIIESKQKIVIKPS